MYINRKNEHLRIAKKNKLIKENKFDKVVLEHNNFADFTIDEVDLSTSFMSYHVKYPFYINAMTGGSKKAYKINKKLAKIAKHFGIPIVLGSLSNALKNDRLLDSYQVVHKIYPNGIIIGNLGSDRTLDDVNKALNMLDLSGFSIHLNIIQEMVMTEGDRNFTSISDNLKKIAENVNVPLLVKEVGFGMSLETLKTLEKINIKYIDVSGKGGTNFAEIENKRNKANKEFYNTLGITTVDSLINAKNINATIYASGGIRNALDIIKALALGAEAVGMSKYFLDLTKLKFADAVKKVDELIIDIKKLMVIYNKKTINELSQIKYYIL